MAAIKTDQRRPGPLRATPSRAETASVMRSELQSDYTQTVIH